MTENERNLLIEIAKMLLELHPPTLWGWGQPGAVEMWLEAVEREQKDGSI